MKKILLIITSVFVSLAMAFVPAYASGDNCDKMSPSDPDYDKLCGICSKISPNVPNYDTLCGGGGEADLQGNVKNILNTVYFWVAIIAVIVIIIGGVKYMTSQGDASKIKSAKDTILYAIIGLIVTLLAFAITNFILRAVGG